MPWTMNRKNVDRLCDVKFPLLTVNDINGRTNTTRFTCILPENQTTRLRKDRVSAMSNGALILKTNKISDPMRRMPWNKQGAVLGFEVITPSLVIS